MKQRRKCPVWCMLMTVALLALIGGSLATAVAQGDDSVRAALPSPTPALGHPPGQASGWTPAHIPYDPTVRHETLPRYPYDALRPPASARPAGGGLPKPSGVDLDVTYISRDPGYHRYEVWYTAEMKPYLRPGSGDDRRWPEAGELVTFTAHFANKGTLPSGSFAFRWLMDGVEVRSGVYPGLTPGGTGTATYEWAWQHELDGDRLVGAHAVRFVLDPGGAIAETYESNNALEDRTDAINLVLAVTPELYAALETPVDPKWPFSAEDWLQKQIAAMNEAFARSIYPSAPDGIVERVRLGKILVTSTDPPVDWEADGGFYMSGDDRQGNPYYHPATDVSGALLHELAHQLGVIDLYNIGAEMLSHQLVDRNGQPVQIETGLSYLGLMLNPGIDPPIFEEHSSLALNANKGFRRGYYGEYLFDLPGAVRLRVFDATGAPAAGVDVKLYQAGPGRDLYPTITDGVPEIAGMTDGAGLLTLTNRPVGAPVTTRTRHTLADNPFGIVDIIGERDEFIVELGRATHQEYGWLEITRLNLAAWRGEAAEATIEIKSHVPVAGAPQPSDDLTGEVEFGQVVLRWPASPAPGVVRYNLYRTRFQPDFTYERVVTGISATEQADPYDYSQRAVTYAVAAMDAEGRESGFSRFFNAFSLVNPAAVAPDESGGRIVLDPQNGYPVLYQAADGRWLDTLGSVHHHLEFSWYMARDGNGRLIFSHPGDWYSPRHSVKVASAANDPLFEFGETGSGPGQFINPTGVAAWGAACSIEGPYITDVDTLLLLHFDGSTDGTGGEVGTSSGTSFAAGRYGQGLSVGQVANLSYETAGNLNAAQGAIEFWVRPAWDGDDEKDYNFFEVGQEWFNRIRITKDGANNLRLMVWDDRAEYGVAYNVGHWRAGEWHHVAATWTATELALYTDGELRGRATETRPPQNLAARMFIGSDSGGGNPAQAVMDEFRISSEPRVGNSDTCGRILVADSGNNRIQAFDALGGFLSAYGGTGSGPGEFQSPQGLAVDDRGRVIVADAGNNRLQLLNFDGRNFGYLRSIGGFTWPTGVWAYGSDRILVADTGANAVKELIPEGGTYIEKVYAPYNAPHGVAADMVGRLIVADTGNRRIVTLPGALPTFTPTPKVSPTPTPSPTPTASQTPVPCSEQVTNGGFEKDVAWDFPVTASRAGYTTAQTHTGARSARFGLLPTAEDLSCCGRSSRSTPVGPTEPPLSERNLFGELAADNASFSSGYQTISIPADAASATLTFWYKPRSEALAGGDYQRVMLLNPAGYTYIATLMKVLEDSDAWQQAKFDLSAYRGRSIVLYFEVYNDNINASPRAWMFLDDVSVQTCPAPPHTLTATPSVTPTATTTTTIPGAISGIVWQDRDGDGSQDLGEPGLAGVTLQLLRWDVQLAEMQSALDGGYRFAPLIPGALYRVREAQPAGWRWSTTPDNVQIGLANGQEAIVNFGDWNGRPVWLPLIVR